MNYNERFRSDLVSAGGGSTSSILSSNTDVKITGNVLYDTTSNPTAFSGLAAGDTIKMTGWDQTENNGIMDVVEVESLGEWIKVTGHLVDVANNDVPAGGITIDKASEFFTISDMTKKDYVNDAVNFNVSSEGPSNISPSDLGVTNDGKVACFASNDSGDSIVVFWSDVSQG